MKKIFNDNFNITPVEDACMFCKTFDVSFTFYKILENACRILQALQNDCIMEVYRKFFDALCKKFSHFLCDIQKFLQVFVITMQNFIFQKDHYIYFNIFTKFSLQLRKFSCALFNITCNGAIFYDYVKIWLFKQFPTQFS